MTSFVIWVFQKSMPSFKKKHLLSTGVTFSWYRHRQKEFMTFYCEEENVVYCKNTYKLMSQLTLQYGPFKWRLFIDSPESGLKAVLLPNGNIFPSIPVAHLINLKGNYKDLAVILQKLRYEDHGWMICIDFKMISTLLGQRLGFTKYPCFLCMWDSRARDLHWKRNKWPNKK